MRRAAPANEPGPLVAAARAVLVPRLVHGMSDMGAGVLALGRTGTHSPPLGQPPTDLSPRCTTDWNELRTLS